MHSVEDFIQRYKESWASGSPESLRAIWQPDGVLDHPTLSKPIPGRLLPAFSALNHATLPDLKWRLLSWASAGALVFLEWECTATINGTRVQWCGVDKMKLRAGRIEEEVVYSDTLPLWAALDRSMVRDALIDADQLSDIE